MNVFIIEAKDLRIGDVILRDKREIEVKSIERGPSCTGLHLNVVRRDARAIKNKQGKVIGLNADRGAIIYNDGCWQPCQELIVRRAMSDA